MMTIIVIAVTAFIELTVLNILLALFNPHYNPLRYTYSIIPTLRIRKLMLTENVTGSKDLEREIS